MIGIRSLRIYALLIHFMVSFTLIWTSMDSITVAYESQTEREDEMENYRFAIAFSIVCLCFEGIFLGTSLNRVTFFSVISFFLDCVGILFTLWIALDGLAWHTYAVVATICIYIPTLFSLLIFIMKFVRDVKVRSTRPQYIDAGLLTRLRLMFSS